jgi:hypothetical protein
MGTLPQTKNKRRIDMPKQYLKYGGVRFINNATPEEINAFVDGLSETQRRSLFNVVTLLEEEGFISLIEGDTTTIDKNMEEFLVPNSGPELK